MSSRAIEGWGVVDAPDGAKAIFEFPISHEEEHGEVFKPGWRERLSLLKKGGVRVLKDVTCWKEGCRYLLLAVPHVEDLVVYRIGEGEWLALEREEPLSFALRELLICEYGVSPLVQGKQALHGARGGTEMEALLNLMAERARKEEDFFLYLLEEPGRPLQTLHWN